MLTPPIATLENIPLFDSPCGSRELGSDLSAVGWGGGWGGVGDVNVPCTCSMQLKLR